MGLLRSIGENLTPLSVNFEDGKHPSPEKEDLTYTFSEELDLEGFPKIFALKTAENRMFLRIVFFFTGRIIWARYAHKLSTLEILLGLQFLEWFENLSIQHNSLTKELHLCFQIWNFILSKDSEDTQRSITLKAEARLAITSDNSTYGHLHFRAYRSECKRETFHKYIREFVISQREIQRKHLPGPSHFKRSSDHSSSQRRSSSFSELKPRVKDFSPFELLELLELSPLERKIQLQGESSENSS